MSVQAGDSLYSSPRTDSAQDYSQVECGFPSERTPDSIFIIEDDEVCTMEHYKESSSTSDAQVDCIFPYTPIKLVDSVIASHGGLHIRCMEIIDAHKSMRPKDLKRLLETYETMVQKEWDSKVTAKTAGKVYSKKVAKVSEPEFVTAPMKSWKEFKRTHAEIFYGCVDKEGHWFDSAEDYSTAVHWCACYRGHTSESPMWEAAWMEDNAKDLGLSIIHSTLLEKMYGAGLIR